MQILDFTGINLHEYKDLFKILTPFGQSLYNMLRKEKKFIGDFRDFFLGDYTLIENFIGYGTA